MSGVTFCPCGVPECRENDHLFCPRDYDAPAEDDARIDAMMVGMFPAVAGAATTSLEDWTPAEPDEILDIFREMLAEATGDGAAKRRAGEKPSWKVDKSHEGAIFSHLTKWKRGELADADSGAHPLVHAAWRCLAIAWQETHATAGLTYHPRTVCKHGYEDRQRCPLCFV